MTTQEPPVDDTQLVAQITGALERAGLRATPEQILALVPPRRRAEQALTALRQRLDPRTEPAFRFDASHARSSLGDDDGG